MTTDTVLLLDEHVVAQVEGLTQQFYGLAKSPLNPVIVKTEAWEGEGPYVWGNRLLVDPATGEYRLWYAAFRHKDNHYRWGYATSRDGLHWEKPPLHLETFGGQPARNMLAAGPHPDKALRCLERDPRPDCPPEQRYRAIRFTYDGEYASFSPDGIHWTEYPDNPVWRAPSDIIHTMWDPNRQTFVAYFKLWDVHGYQPDPADPTRQVPFQSYMVYYHSKTEAGLTHFKGRRVILKPGGGAETMENYEFTLLAQDQLFDDGGGGMLRGAWTSKRVICWAFSDDFIHWQGERPVIAADELDHPSANIQYMFVFWWGGYYVGVLTMHDETGEFNQQVAFSRDGLTWRRPWRGNFNGVGPPGAWDCGMVLGPVDPIVLDTELRVYYGGFDIIHHSPAKTFNSAIGFGTLRRDGFAAWVADETTGVLTTQPMTCLGDALQVNVDAAFGQVEVEVADADGQPLPGFERQRCSSIRADAVAAPVVWDGRTLAELVGQTIRLRFYLTQARLFAFRWST